MTGAARNVCITIVTIEDDKVELPHILVITLEAKIPSSQLSINPCSVTVVIMDDDGKGYKWYN